LRPTSSPQSFLLKVDHDCWGYRTSIPIRKQSILIAYIVKSIKNQKGKPSEMDLPLLKNDITNNLGPQKPVKQVHALGTSKKMYLKNDNLQLCSAI